MRLMLSVILVLALAPAIARADDKADALSAVAEAHREVAAANDLYAQWVAAVNCRAAVVAAVDAEANATDRAGKLSLGQVRDACLAVERQAAVGMLALELRRAADSSEGWLDAALSAGARPDDQVQLGEKRVALKDVKALCNAARVAHKK